MDKRIERMIEREKALSHEYLTKVLEYEPESGTFIWKIRASRAVKPGDIAGSLNKNGYLLIKVGKYIYRALIGLHGFIFMGNGHQLKHTK